MTEIARFIESASINPEYQKILAKMNAQERDTFVSLLPQGAQQDFKNYIRDYKLGAGKEAAGKELGLAGEKQAYQYGLGKEKLGLRKAESEARFGQAGKELTSRTALSNFRNQLGWDQVEEQNAALPGQVLLGGANVGLSYLAGKKKQEQDEELKRQNLFLANKFGFGG